MKPSTPSLMPITSPALLAPLSLVLAPPMAVVRMCCGFSGRISLSPMVRVSVVPVSMAPSAPLPGSDSSLRLMPPALSNRVCGFSLLWLLQKGSLSLWRIPRMPFNSHLLRRSSATWRLMMPTSLGIVSVLALMLIPGPMSFPSRRLFKVTLRLVLSGNV